MTKKKDEWKVGVTGENIGDYGKGFGNTTGGSTAASGGATGGAPAGGGAGGGAGGESSMDVASKGGAANAFGSGSGAGEQVGNVNDPEDLKKKMKKENKKMNVDVVNPGFDGGGGGGDASGDAAGNAGGFGESVQKFEKFLESLKGYDNESLIESVKEGFQACFESQYGDIIFLQDDQANEVMNILREKGEDAAMDYLSQWDYGDVGEVRDEIPAGNADEKYERGEYIMHYNTPLGYAGLIRKLSID